MHMPSRKDLNSDELETVKVSKKTVDGCYSQRRADHKRRGNSVCQSIRFIRDRVLLKDALAVLSLGKLCEDHGYTYYWTSGQKPQLIQNSRRMECNTANYVPFVVPGLSTSSSSSSSPTSPTSSSQEAVIPTQHPASARNESMSDGVRGNSSRGPSEIENPNKNDNEGARGGPLRDLPEQLEEFKENLVDDSVPEYRDAPSSSHELSS